jgi:CD63 antigen
MLLLVFILELSGGIAGYVLRNRAREFLNKRLNDSMYEFESNNETRELWYLMQTSVSSLTCKHV